MPQATNEDAPGRPAALVARIDALATRHHTPCGAGAMTWRVWGDGAPLVLLHGATGAWTHWIRNIPALATRFRLLVPDMPGFGDSDMPPPPHTADTLADVVASGLDVLLPRLDMAARFDIAGFSFGGIIGGLVAARMGRRVGRLVLLGAGGFGLSPLSMPTLARIEREMAPGDIERVHRENLLALMLAKPENADALAVHIQAENVRLARFKSGTIPTSDVLLKALPAIRARISGIWAGRDAFAASRAARIDEYRQCLAAVQPAVDFRVIPDAGHWSPYDAAEEVTTALLDMLRPGRT